MDKGTPREILEKIARVRHELQEHYTVERIGLFGSYARGEAGLRSDVDILVEFREPTFDHYMDCKFMLEELLSLPVDLVMAETLKARIRRGVEREVVYV